jgi:hypothetical protein
MKNARHQDFSMMAGTIGGNYLTILNNGRPVTLATHNRASAGDKNLRVMPYTVALNCPFSGFIVYMLASIDF